MAQNGPLSKLVDCLPKYALDKMEVVDEFKEKLMEELKVFYRDYEYDDTDGLKIYSPQGSVLIRPSGTELKIRIYSEVKDGRTAEELGVKTLASQNLCVN